MQFREGLSDRQAAEAVRARIDWKYLLALDLIDPGFDHSLLCEFRGRLLQHAASERLLACILDAARDQGLLKARRRQRTDSTHVLAAVRDLNRVELLAETLRAALNAIATAAPAWLRALAPPEWHTRYDHRVEETCLPETGAKREAYVLQVGADGYRLLDALDDAAASPLAAALPAITVLRRVWARHFERWDGTDGEADPVRLRDARGRCPGDRVESPYDIDARFRAKSGTDWTGYMVHLTETCDPGLPRLVVHTDHHAGQRARSRSHRRDPRSAVRGRLGSVRASGRCRIRERRAAGGGHCTARHRPDRPDAVQSQLAAARCRGDPGGGLHRRLGAPQRALPGGA